MCPSKKYILGLFSVVTSKIAFVKASSVILTSSYELFVYSYVFLCTSDFGKP